MLLFAGLEPLLIVFVVFVDANVVIAVVVATAASKAVAASENEWMRVLSR